MYLGVLLILFAEAILFRSAWILLYAAMLWLALHSFAVLLEEPQLERRFGDTYRAYRAHTPRWLPRRPKH
jgi:protein-S-isoprenylcysteine O-methyltransferase Ste14